MLIFVQLVVYVVAVMLLILFGWIADQLSLSASPTSRQGCSPRRQQPPQEVGINDAER